MIRLLQLTHALNVVTAQSRKSAGDDVAFFRLILHIYYSQGYSWITCTSLTQVHPSSIHSVGSLHVHMLCPLKWPQTKTSQNICKQLSKERKTHQMATCGLTVDTTLQLINIKTRQLSLKPHPTHSTHLLTTSTIIFGHSINQGDYGSSFPGALLTKWWSLVWRERLVTFMRKAVDFQRIVIHVIVINTLN